MNARIVAVFGNLVIAETDGRVVQNSVAYCVRSDGARLLSEVIRVRGHLADLQVFEETRGLRVGDAVEFQDEMLSVVLGPGLLGKIYDGLQNPLAGAGRAGRVTSSSRASTSTACSTGAASGTSRPSAKPGDVVSAGDTLGTVPEGIFTHRIMVPFGLARRVHRREDRRRPAQYTVEHEIAVLTDSRRPEARR